VWAAVTTERPWMGLLITQVHDGEDIFTQRPGVHTRR